MRPFYGYSSGAGDTGRMLAAFFLLLNFLTDAVYSQENCSYQDVLNYLNLTRNQDHYSMTRPVKNYLRPTQVNLEVLLYAILDVVEKDQKFIACIWTVTTWHNEYISWDPDQFCGISTVFIPKDLLWKPDLTIEEMTEKDRAPPSPYMIIYNNGEVEVQNDQVLVSTCRMHIYNFPFDIQSCNLSFRSVIHPAKDIRLRAIDNSSVATKWSRDMMQTQYEWLFINMTVTTHYASDPLHQDGIVYTINMRRRSALYIVNFILPILFFLCLDLASFLISENSGEKLSFQVTVLLAITVLQLILNEILPSSSNKIPLIAVYCIGVFTLMMFSLLETILLMYLREKDNAPQDDGTEADRRPSADQKGDRVDFHNYHREKHNWAEYGCIYDGAAETPSDPLSMAIEHNSSHNLMEESHVLEKVSGELREMEKMLSVLVRSKKEHKPGYWTRLSKRINKMFFISYVLTICGFLTFLFLQWNV